MNEAFIWPERDEQGRFLPGHRWASKGGQARARALTPERRREIARLGWRALVKRRFNGDAKAAKAWLTAKGLAALDQDMSPELQKFDDPGPMPEEEQAFILSDLTGPPGPVARAEDCPGYGQELPTDWRCPDNCPIARACFEALEGEEEAADQSG